MPQINTRPIELSEAVSHLKAAASPLEARETVAVTESLGRILAEDIFAPFDQPPFPRSPLDGYAIRSNDSQGASKDSPVTLRVIGEVDAGDVFRGSIRDGEAVRIMTGAPIPDGADAIIMQEDTDYGESHVRIYRSLSHHQNYVFQGEDYHKGTLLLKQYDLITPAEITILASCGFTHIKVLKKPQLLLISTGNELLRPGDVLQPGKIYDSNLYALQAQLNAWHIDTQTIQIGDDITRVCEIIMSRISEVDLIITTGGVSVGKKDIMHDVFETLSVEKLFWKVAIKPGMAMMAGRYQNTLILSLSGNPYAAFVDFHLLVRPVLNALLKTDAFSMIRMKTKLMHDYDKKSRVKRYIRAYVNNQCAYIEGHLGGNGDIYATYCANALIEIPEGTPSLQCGDDVDVYFFR